MGIQDAACRPSPLGVTVGSLSSPAQPYQNVSLEKDPHPSARNGHAPVLLVHWQGTRHDVRNGTKLKFFLSSATAFPLCASFNRRTAHLTSSCDTSHCSLAFNTGIPGCCILTAEKLRFICYAKALRYIPCEENVPTCTFAHLQGCFLAKRSRFCSATWQHRATRPLGRK